MPADFWLNTFYAVIFSFVFGFFLPRWFISKDMGVQATLVLIMFGGGWSVVRNYGDFGFLEGCVRCTTWALGCWTFFAGLKLRELFSKEKIK